MNSPATDPVPSGALSAMLDKYESELLIQWMSEQLSSSSLRKDLMRESDLRDQSKQFLLLLRTAVRSDNGSDISIPEWDAVRDLLTDISKSRAARGYTPSETASFIFSLRNPLLELIHRESGGSTKDPADSAATSTLLDKLGLYTFEEYQKTREGIIDRQQREMTELSTPVVRLFDGIVAVPLIGTLDSARTQVVMENLLQRIVETEASIAIIDITGVPTVDTLVAQHLLKTVAAARLMGADCIISGIRPQIAQTIIHLGVDLQNVTTKATMADALVLALKTMGFSIGRGEKRGRRLTTGNGEK